MQEFRQHGPITNSDEWIHSSVKNPKPLDKPESGMNTEYSGVVVGGVSSGNLNVIAAYNALF